MYRVNRIFSKNDTEYNVALFTGRYGCDEKNLFFDLVDVVSGWKLTADASEVFSYIKNNDICYGGFYKGYGVCTVCSRESAELFSSIKYVESYDLSEVVRVISDKDSFAKFVAASETYGESEAISLGVLGVTFLEAFSLGNEMDGVIGLQSTKGAKTTIADCILSGQIGVDYFLDGTNLYIHTAKLFTLDDSESKFECFKIDKKVLVEAL